MKGIEGSIRNILVATIYCQVFFGEEAIRHARRAGIGITVADEDRADFSRRLRAELLNDLPLAVAASTTGLVDSRKLDLKTVRGEVTDVGDHLSDHQVDYVAGHT